MKNQTHDSQKVIFGLVIGATIGIGILSYWKASHHRPKPILHKIGKTLAEVGNMLEHTDFGSCSKGISTLEKQAPKASGLISDFMEYAYSGMDFWKKLNNGR